MTWKPIVEINIPLNSGDIDRWALAVDDHCVVVLQWHEREQVCSGGAGQATTEGWIEAGWRPVRGGYIPSNVAAHMSALAVQDLANDAACQWALHVERRILEPTTLPADAQRAAEPKTMN